MTKDELERNRTEAHFDLLKQQNAQQFDDSGLDEIEIILTPEEEAGLAAMDYDDYDELDAALDNIGENGLGDVDDLEGVDIK
jgi:hypothetical protein